MQTPIRILIVEDEPLIVRALSRMLRRHHVQVASSLAELARTQGAFDVAFCDIGLSDGCALLGISAINTRRLVLMSGAPPPIHARQLIADGSAAWLAKPFVRDELMACIAA